MPRVFFALELPSKLRSRLNEEVVRMRKAEPEVSWVEPENYHVTLRFLGEVDDDAVLAASRCAESVLARCAPFDLVAVGLGASGEPDRPRVLWCGIKGRDEAETERLHDLRRSLDLELRKSGFHREKLAFSPHITLGRVRGERNLQLLMDRMGPAVRREFGHFRVPEVVLYESRKGREGSEYTPLATLAAKAKPLRPAALPDVRLPPTE